MYMNHTGDKLCETQHTAIRYDTNIDWAIVCMHGIFFNDMPVNRTSLTHSNCNSKKSESRIQPIVVCITANSANKKRKKELSHAYAYKHKGYLIMCYVYTPLQSHRHSHINVKYRLRSIFPFPPVCIVHHVLCMQQTHIYNRRQTVL